jgi:hypothetical protein
MLYKLLIFFFYFIFIAINHDPELRPKITEILEVLNNCFEESESQVFHISNISQDHIDLANIPVEQNEVSSTVFEVKISIIIPFAKFLPIINEIEDTFNEIIELVEVAEHNKRICEILKKRVCAVQLDVRNLRIGDKEDNGDFFNSKNYLSLQNFSTIIMRIKKFISDISQMKSLIKYIRAKSIEKTFKVLCEEFDSFVNVLFFSINVQAADELEQLKADQEDLAKVRL